MTEQEKLWAKRRVKAAKLSGPKPVELPSHSWRCQVMVDGRRPRGCTCESAGNQNGDAGEQGQRTKGDG